MVSALRVVIPTRLTIVRSLLCRNVYIGNKRTKTLFFKPGFVTLKLCQIEERQNLCLSSASLYVSFHLVLGVVYPCAAYFEFSR